MLIFVKGVIVFAIPSSVTKNVFKHTRAYKKGIFISKRDKFLSSNRLIES